MVVEYMVTCEEIGLQTAREVLLHVPLRILEPAPKAISTDDVVVSPTSHLEDLLEVCDEHKFEDTKANICRVGGVLPCRMVVSCSVRLDCHSDARQTKRVWTGD